MDTTSCFMNCSIGIKAKDKILKENDSVFDAVFDFSNFIEGCLKSCPYKSIHEKQTKENVE